MQTKQITLRTIGNIIYGICDWIIGSWIIFVVLGFILFMVALAWTIVSWSIWPLILFGIFYATWLILLFFSLIIGTYIDSLRMKKIHPTGK